MRGSLLLSARRWSLAAAMAAAGLLALAVVAGAWKTADVAYDSVIR